MSKAKIPPKAHRIHPPDSGPPPPQSLFDLMLPLLIEDNPPNAVAGPSSQTLDTPKHVTDEEEEPFNISNMVAFAPPPDDLESKEEDEKDELDDEQPASPALIPGEDAVEDAEDGLDDEIGDNAMAVDVCEPAPPAVKQAPTAVQPARTISVSATANISETSSAILLRTTGSPFTAASTTKSNIIPISLSTAGASLFREGAADQRDPTPADEELEESEPSIDGIMSAAAVLHTLLSSFLLELDSYCSLMKHHKATKENKKD
ncbi:hypothetical protein V8E53_000656 [Lactarius tabidus]